MNENELMEENEDMLPEYHFNYSKARPNRFAKGIAEGSLVVVRSRNWRKFSKHLNTLSQFWRR